MEIPIVVKSEVMCPILHVNVLLSLCRGCPRHVYETVDGKVICNYIIEPRKKGDKGNG